MPVSSAAFAKVSMKTVAEASIGSNAFLFLTKIVSTIELPNAQYVK